MKNFSRTIGVIAIVLIVAVAGVTVLHAKKSTPTGPTTTTTTTTVPIAPLTGLPDPGGAALQRPALTVKIENDPNSLPQWGVDQADVVYEEIVNGGITRLAAIFNQNAPAQVGPVRSVRPTDTQIVWPIGGIFAFSGGAQYAINSISTVPGLKLVTESSAGAAMYRDPQRVAPYNLYGIVPKLFAFGGTPTPPAPLFTYHAANAVPAGTPVKSFVVPFPSIYVTDWTWDAAAHGWLRFRPQFLQYYNDRDITGTGKNETPQNVVVMSVNYVNGVGTMASYGDLQSSGKVAIFEDGREIQGTWSRSATTAPIMYYDNQHHVIPLQPGQTWVELLDNLVSVSVTK